MKIKLDKNATIAVIWIGVVLSSFAIGFGAIALGFFALIITDML